MRVLEDRLLVCSEDVGREMSCVPLSNSCFACDVGLVEFQVGEDGRAASITLGKVYTLRRG